jgi:PsbP
MQNRREKSIILAILGAILIATITGIYFFYIQQGQRFDTYKSPVYGFRIAYPAGWDYAENKNGAAVIFYSPVENDLDYFRESINIVVQDLPADVPTLKDYSELAIKQMEAVFKKNFLSIESREISFAGKPGYRLAFVGKGKDTELKYLIAWTLDGPKAYQVTYTALASQYDRYLAQAEAMLKSFRIK